MTEFRRDALEGLRQPLEDGRVVITRANGSVEFPSRFTLVAAANPCPCGFANDPSRVCHCPDSRRAQYSGKMSGPLLDRIDIRLSIPRLTKHELLGEEHGESSAAICERVCQARDRQRRRYEGLGVACNAHLPGPFARRRTERTAGADALLAQAVESIALTGRGFDRALKVSQTIADLAGADVIDEAHVAEALSYRGSVPTDARLADAG